MKNFNKQLQSYCNKITSEFNIISNERKDQLIELAKYIISLQNINQDSNLIFICTHNSRRSHFGQIWAQTAAYWYQIYNVKTYSGGTEATAFNKRSVAALIRAGFTIENSSDGSNDNPIYKAKQGDEYPFFEMFSKKYDDKRNPNENFSVIMVCSDADENCPFIPGANKRFSIKYEDPKAFDDTAKELMMYDERCAQVAREMFYVVNYVSNNK